MVRRSAVVIEHLIRIFFRLSRFLGLVFGADGVPFMETESLVDVVLNFALDIPTFLLFHYLDFLRVRYYLFLELHQPALLIVNMLLRRSLCRTCQPSVQRYRLLHFFVHFQAVDFNGASVFHFLLLQLIHHHVVLLHLLPHFLLYHAIAMLQFLFLFLFRFLIGLIMHSMKFLDAHFCLLLLHGCFLPPLDILFPAFIPDPFQLIFSLFLRLFGKPLPFSFLVELALAGFAGLSLCALSKVLLIFLLSFLIQQ